MATAVLETTSAERQLVVFDLDSEAYGVDIGAVREIIRMQDITTIPRTPDFVEGVINLRGKVIPVVDIGGQDIGAVVDAVTEVLRILGDSVEPPSSVITTADSDYLMGIAKVEDRLIILLDLESVLSEEEREILTESPIET